MPREACQKIVLEYGECIALSSVLESLGFRIWYTLVLLVGELEGVILKDFKVGSGH
jgi:hypothetical protein